MNENLKSLIEHYDAKISSLTIKVNDFKNFIENPENYIKKAEEKHTADLTSFQNSAYMTEANNETGKNFTESEAKERVKKSFRFFEEAKRKPDMIEKMRKEYEAENSKLEQYKAKRVAVISAKKYIANPPQGHSDEKAIAHDANFRLCGQKLHENKYLLMKESDPRELKLIGSVIAGLFLVGIPVLIGLAIHSKITKGTFDFLAPKSAEVLEIAKNINILPKLEFTHALKL